MEFKRVPALDKCFKILDLAARSNNGIGISEAAKTLGYNKSTVFNIVHTLASLGILANGNNAKFVLGPRLYVLGKLASQNFSLVDVAHPWLEKVTAQTKLSSFLGVRSGDRVTIIDKVDSPIEIKVSSEVGMRIPLLAGATGKVFLAQMPDDKVVELLGRKELKAYTSRSCTDPVKYLQTVREVRRQGFALDDEEYIEGIRAIAVPLRTISGTLSYPLTLLEALNDDLNISQALAAVDQMISKSNEMLDKEPKNKGLKKEIRANIAFLEEVLGIGTLDAYAYFQIGISEEEKKKIQILIQNRDKAKAEKDYEKSDAIRDELKALGISIMDTANGTVWEKVQS